jgi:hypothetical protein
MYVFSNKSKTYHTKREGKMKRKEKKRKEKKEEIKRHL